MVIDGPLQRRPSGGSMAGTPRPGGCLDAVTAYHESGHAVAASMLGRPFTRVSIQPDGITLGRCSFRRPGPWFRPEVKMTRRTRERIEERIVISLAGPHSQTRFTGEFDELGAREDFGRALELAEHVTGGDDEESRAYVEWLTRRTVRLMRQPQFWPAVESLAGALLERGEIAYRDARKIIDQALARFAPAAGAAPSGTGTSPAHTSGGDMAARSSR